MKTNHRMATYQKMVVVGSIVITTTSALAADLKAIQILPTQAVTLPAATQAVSPVAAPAALPQASSPAALPANGVQIQKAPMALPQANSPAALPANGGVQVVKPVGNFGGAKVIQFQKGVTTLDLSKESDSTVLINPTGGSMTVRELKQSIKNQAPKPVLSDAKVAITPSKIKNIPSLLNGSTKYSANLAKTVSQFEGVAVLAKTCEEQGLGPQISKVLGDVTPGSIITIKGRCFDASKGQVRLSGSTINKIVMLDINQWGENQVTAKVPAMSGASEGQGLIEVITNKDKGTRSFPVDFTPTYELIDVSKYWSACGSNSEDYYTKQACSPGHYTAHTEEYTGAIRAVHDGYPMYAGGGNFSIRVSPSCKLNQGWAQNHMGQITSFTGFENGPPNESTVSVGVKFHEHLATCWCGDTKFGDGAFTVKADAYCPVGVSPNP